MTCCIRVNPRLEFSAVLFSPALYYDFLVGVELDGVAALAVEIAEEAVLPSAEREVGHGRGDSDVDADISCRSFVAEAARGGSARREQRCLIAVRAAFEEREGFIHGIGVNEAYDGTEDFCISKIAGRGNVVEDRGLHKVAVLVFRDLRVAAIEQDLRALLFAEVDERLDALFTLRRDHGPHLHAFVEAVTDFQLRSSVGNEVTESLLRFSDGYGDRNGEATLAGASERAVADDLRSHGHVGVGENDDVILGSALALATLPLLARARVDVARDRSRSDEADGANFGMVDERVDHGLAAVDQTHYALGQSGFLEKFVNVMHGERDALGRLQNKSIPGCDGVGQIPERNHPRKIEGRDGGDDAERLANHHLVDAADNILEVVPLHHHGNAAGDFDILDAAGDVVDVLFEKHLQLEEWLNAVFRRSAAPFREGGGGGFDRLVNFCGLDKRNL